MRGEGEAEDRKTMKTETKQRIAIFCTGIPLALLAATVGACLGGWTDLIWNFGWPPRDPIADFGAPNEILNEMPGGGFDLAIRFVSPALVTMIVFHAVRLAPLGKHTLVTSEFSFLVALSAIMIHSMLSASLVEWMLGYENYLKLSKIILPNDLVYIVNVAICVAIVVVVELLMKKKLQTEVSLRQYLPMVIAWAFVVALHACYYAASTIAQAGPSDQAYMRSWSYQLLAFAFLRFPFWLLALVVFFTSRAVYLRWAGTLARRA